MKYNEDSGTTVDQWGHTEHVWFTEAAEVSGVDWAELQPSSSWEWPVEWVGLALKLWATHYYFPWEIPWKLTPAKIPAGHAAQFKTIKQPACNCKYSYRRGQRRKF